MMKARIILASAVAAVSFSTAPARADEPQPQASGAEAQLLAIDLKIALKQYEKLKTQQSEMLLQDVFPPADSPSEQEEAELRQRREHVLEQKLDELRMQILKMGKKMEPPAKDRSPAANASPSKEGALDTIPGRDPQATAKQIDLGRFYNVLLTQAWHSGTAGNDLSELPGGLQDLDGTRFEIRGAVQMCGAASGQAEQSFPREVPGIPVHLKTTRLHFLHGTGFMESDGVQLGEYVVHYANGGRETCPIIYGETVRDWWYYPGTPKEATQSHIAWTGSNAAAKSWNPPGSSPVTLRLYKTTWSNPHPDLEITAIDLVSEEKNSVPFLIAVTAE